MAPTLSRNKAIHGGRISSLDGLRGIFAFLVVLSHYYGSQMGWDSYPFKNAGIAVDFFFVLSGFVLCHVYEEKFRKKEIEDGVFVWHRIVRLYPLHIATMLGAGIVHYLLWRKLPYQDGVGWTTVTNVLLIQGLGFDKSWSWNDPAWSISTELWVGVLLLPIVFRSVRTQFLLIVALIGYGYLYRSGSMLHEVQSMTALGPASVVRTVCGLFVGVALRRVSLVLSKSGLPTLKPLLLMVGCFEAAALIVSIGVAYGRVPGRVEFFGLLSAIFVVFCFSIFDTWMNRIISSAPFKFIGAISFSVYLTSFPLLGLMMHGGLNNIKNETARLVVYLIAVIAVAFASYALFEMPIYRRFRNKILQSH